jgi:hypothetical protein
MQVELESHDGITTLVCKAAEPNELVRVHLIGTRADGSDVSIFYEFRCNDRNEQIALRLQPGMEVEIQEFTRINSSDVMLRLLENLSQTQLRPQTNGIADQANRTNILL